MKSNELTELQTYTLRATWLKNGIEKADAIAKLFEGDKNIINLRVGGIDLEFNHLHPRKVMVDAFYELARELQSAFNELEAELEP